MTISELQAAVNGAEMLTRADVQDALALYADPGNEYINIQLFLEGITVLTDDQKLAVLNDLESYA